MTSDKQIQMGLDQVTVNKTIRIYLDLSKYQTSDMKTYLSILQKSVLVLFTIFNLVRCSPNRSNTNQIKFIELQSSKLISSYSGLQLQTYSRLQALDNLINYKDSLSLDLEFNLIDEDSSFSVVAYTNSMITYNGTIIEFKNADGILDIYMYSKDYPKFHFCHLEHFISENNEVKLKLQFLNTSSFGPVINIWNRSNLFSENKKRNFNYINLYTSECSSLKNNIPISQFGVGTLWGIEIYKTKIKSIKRTETYVL
jgi:hypothetical protein